MSSRVPPCYYTAFPISLFDLERTCFFLSVWLLLETGWDAPPSSVMVQHIFSESSWQLAVLMLRKASQRELWFRHNCNTCGIWLVASGSTLLKLTGLMFWNRQLCESALADARILWWHPFSFARGQMIAFKTQTLAEPRTGFVTSDSCHLSYRGKATLRGFFLQPISVTPKTSGKGIFKGIPLSSPTDQTECRQSFCIFYKSAHKSVSRCVGDFLSTSI